MTTFVIVGGGIAGLYTARNLAVKYPQASITLLESKHEVGGRLGTAFSNLQPTSSLPLYDTGAWRIPATHERHLALLRELQIDTLPIDVATHNATHRVVQGLSTTDVNILEHGVQAALHLDLKKGYMDQSDAASGSKPYFTDADQFFVPRTGFAGVVRALLRSLPANVQVMTDTFVTNISKDCDVEGALFTVSARERQRHDRTNAFIDVTYTASHLFLALPPRFMTQWDLCHHYFPCLPKTVQTVALHHIYAHGPRQPVRHINDSTHPRLTRLGQVVPRTYRWSQWFQISYSSGRLARFWNRLKLAQPRMFRALLDREAGHPLNDVRSHMHEDAIHVWKPVPYFDLDRSVRRAVHPLPHVYVVGEAFSSHQGWVEGALQTSELALDVLDTHFSEPCDDLPVLDDQLRYSWAAVHPGGQDPIMNHWQDGPVKMMKFMDHVGHSDFAHACLWHMQKVL